MDVYDGSGSLTGSSLGNRIHDWNPGITDFDPNVVDTGLFWTTQIPGRSVTVNPGNGRARMRVSDISMPDFTTGPNALVMGPSVPGVVSFHIEWVKSRAKRRFGNAQQTWQANVVLTEARAAWQGETEFAKYVSDPLMDSFSLFAEVGHERNGVFFS